MNFNLKNQLHSLFMEQFSIQLLHQKIQFAAFGFFQINFSLLMSIIAAITTYLVVLIQFRMNN
jgi:gustatory receptor